MATRRRRSTPRPVGVTPEPTHEEMLEVAAEREVANEAVEEEAAIEAILSAALADTFEAIQKAEEEKGIEDFFDPGSYENKVTRVPVILDPTTPVVPSQPQRPAQLQREPRYLIRQNRHPKYNQG